MKPTYYTKSMMNKPQAGVAVVSAMLLAALVVLLSTSMMYEQQRFINRLENHFSATQARWMSEAAIHWSRAILAEDASAGIVDHFKENWAIRLPVTPLEGGTIAGYIVDQQQYFNLNNLRLAGATSSEHVDEFKRLLPSIGSNPDATDALIDWIDSDSDVTYPHGAESGHYLAQAVPYRAGNQLFTEIGNLSRVQGLTEEGIARLKQYCTVLPEGTPVNINTASPALLGFMLPALSQTELQTIVAGRNLQPFIRVSDVGKLFEHSKVTFSERQFSVGSHFFLMTGQTKFGKSTVNVEALLKRDKHGWPQLLWKRYR